MEYRLQPGDPAQIAAKMEELMARRKEKQPYDMPSAGSVFKRPQGALAAALIEECGLKGRRVWGRPGQREARRVHRQHRRGHLRRRAGPHPADPGRGV